MVLVLVVVVVGEVVLVLEVVVVGEVVLVLDVVEVVEVVEVETAYLLTSSFIAAVN